jgi:hypothetical protein
MLTVAMRENGLEAHRYLNIDDLRAHKEGALRLRLASPAASLHRRQ